MSQATKMDVGTKKSAHNKRLKQVNVNKLLFNFSRFSLEALALSFSAHTICYDNRRRRVVAVANIFLWFWVFWTGVFLSKSWHFVYSCKCCTFSDAKDVATKYLRYLWKPSTISSVYDLSVRITQFELGRCRHCRHRHPECILLRLTLNTSFAS